MTEDTKAKIHHFHMFIAAHQDYGLRQKFLFLQKLLTNDTL